MRCRYGVLFVLTLSECAYVRERIEMEGLNNSQLEIRVVQCYYKGCSTTKLHTHRSSCFEDFFFLRGFPAMFVLTESG